MNLIAPILITITAIVLLKSAIKNKPLLFSFSTIVFLSLFLSGFYLVSDYLTGDGINQAVVYHLNTNMGGAGLKDFKFVIVASSIYLFTTLMLSIFAHRRAHAKKQYPKNRYRIFIAFFILSLSFTLSPATSDLYEIFSGNFSQDDTSHPRNLILTKALDGEGNKKNIIFLYLESIERTYFDEDLFPGLVPNLKKLEKQALSFSDINQAYATGWTIAGMTASQCGIPLITASGGNSMSGADRFLPGASCIGDLLSKKGYNLNYLGGSSLEFAGKGNFYKTHGFQNIIGRDELLRTLVDPNYTSPWGLYDDTLYTYAKERLDTLSKSDDPFGFFMLTLDTHHPVGHMSKSCDGVIYDNGDNPILNAIHCADKLASGFIRDVLDSELYEDTLVVVASDHLAMRNSAWEQLQKRDRNNLFMIFSKDLEPGLIHKPGSTLDVAPTLINLMGYDIKGLGFGRSLLDEGSSIYKSNKEFNELLARSKGFLNSFWSFPELKTDLILDQDNRELIINDRSVRYPVIFMMNQKNQVTDIRFDFNSPKSLALQLSEFDYDQKFLWVDECKKNGWLDQSYSEHNHRICAAVGTLGSNNNTVLALEGSTAIKQSLLEEKLEGLTSKLSVYNKIKDKLSNIRAYGTADVNKYSPEENLFGSVLAKSTGGIGRGESFVKNLDTDKVESVSRGLTLFGVNDSGVPINLSHFDTCGGELHDNFGSSDGFGAIIQKSSGLFGAFLVIAHDSAVCNPYDFSRIFEGTGLRRWKAIGFRQPYIGVISGNGHIEEYVGTTGSDVTVMMENFVRPTYYEKQRELAWLPLVAHAGGGYEGSTYTNSINALNSNYYKYDLFEIDFSWTEDQRLVCLHDWEASYSRSFDLKSEGKKTYNEFVNLVQTRSPFEKCTLPSLVEWLRAHPNAIIVTDIKEQNIKALRRISKNFPSLVSRFVPQIYNPSEYYLAKLLGYKDIIWSLYRFNGSDGEVLDHLKYMNLLGLTMPKSRANRGLAIGAYDKTGVLSWVHTINDPDELKLFKRLGLSSAYTDWITEKESALFEVRSAGKRSGTSYVRSAQEDNSKFELKRGLTLIGFSYRGKFKKLAYIDSCSPASIESAGLDNGFARVMSDFGDKYQSFAIIAHDSAVCGDRTLENLFEALPLKKWKGLGFRMPYIGLLPQSSQAREFLGEENGNILQTVKIERN